MAHLLGVIPLGCVQNVEKPAAQAGLKTAVQGNAGAGNASEGKQVEQADLKTLVQGNNEFAFDLYHHVSKETGNVVFSPYSISTALAMTYAGARGVTAEKMAGTLHFTLSPERLHPAFGSLAADLQKEDKNRPYHLYVANALWPAKSLALQPEFLHQTQTHYGAGVRQINFGAAEEARNIINTWVEEKTREKIKDLLLPEDVGADTRLVLTNAIYFKAAWQNQFPKENTRDDVFEVAPDKKVTVPMMRHSDGEFNYFAGDGFQWLELPYKGDRLSMVLLLPQQKGKLAEVEKRLTPATLQKGLDNLKMSTGDVFMPRFKIELRLSLLKVLKEMGMSAGPFTAIAKSESLSISDVIHKAFIDVDEVGTEAAAATAVTFMKEKSVGFSFRADHPFFFMIRDRQTRSILFLGRVTDPRSAG